MINFACKTFSLKEVIKCGLGLTKSDQLVFNHLNSNSADFFRSEDIAGKLNLDLSTVQRSVKRLYEKKVLERRQENLQNGGYVFNYTSMDKKKVREEIMKIVQRWIEQVETELDNW